MSNWYLQNGKDSDIVVSSRIRIARNLKNHIFKTRCSRKEKEDILGYNELSREVYISNFLKGKCKKGDIRDQALAIEILYSCALGIKNHYEHKKQSEKIKVISKTNDDINIKDLKKYSDYTYSNDDKTNLNLRIVENAKYEFGTATTYLTEKKLYQVYFFVGDEKNIASSLFCKVFKSNLKASLYYYLLTKLADKKDIKLVAKILNWLNK